MLIDGHARTEVSGDSPIPVLILDVTEEEADKILATFDPLGAMATADTAKLDALLKEVQTDSAAVEAMIASLAQQHDLAEDVPEPGQGGDEFDAAPADGPTRAQLGDVWIIGGKHRLMVGDCTDAGTVLLLMNGAKAALCFTSPPYNAGKYTLTGNVQKKDKSSRYEGNSDDLPEEDYLQFLNGFTLHALRNCELVAVNIQQLANNKRPVLAWAYGFANHFADRAIWYKGSGNPAMARNVMDSRFEDIWIFSPLEKPTRAIPNVDFRGTVENVFCSTGASRDNSVPDCHAATMPMAMCEWALSSWSPPSALIYDPFLGSGTTLIAAHRLGRVCYGCEIEPKYADVILKRAEAEGMACERED